MANAQTGVSAPAPGQNNVKVQDDVNEKKKGKGTFYGMILLAILAIGGIGFGVWAMMDGNAQKTKFEEQISTMRQTINELQGKLNKDTDSDVSIDINTDANDADVTDYIYVGEWGLKIRVPEGLESISYLFDYRASEQYEDYLYINGVVEGYDGIPSFLNTSIKEHWLGCLHRLAQGEEPALRASMGTLVTTIDGSEYYYGGPQAIESENEQDRDLESKTVDLIRQMLTNPENYLKI